MARRFQEITEVYRQEIAALARADRWTAFLRSACRNYKLPFEEQVLVHAQRPDATAVLEIERWNRQFGRWVNKGATGIAVFDWDYPGRTRLKYYFDISDTHESRLSRPVPLWQVSAEQEPDVIEALENRFGTLDDKGTLEEAIVSAMENAAADNVTDYLDDLQDCRDNSLLEELDELNLSVLYRRLLENSTAYTSSQTTLSAFGFGMCIRTRASWNWTICRSFWTRSKRTLSRNSWRLLMRTSARTSSQSSVKTVRWRLPLPASALIG